MIHKNALFLEKMPRFFRPMEIGTMSIDTEAFLERLAMYTFLVCQENNGALSMFD